MRTIKPKRRFASSTPTGRDADTDWRAAMEAHAARDEIFRTKLRFYAGASEQLRDVN